MAVLLQGTTSKVQTLIPVSFLLTQGRDRRLRSQPPERRPNPRKVDIEIPHDILGVRVLDQIIIGRGRYVSFVDDGYW